MSPINPFHSDPSPPPSLRATLCSTVSCQPSGCMMTCSRCYSCGVTSRRGVFSVKQCSCTKKVPVPSLVLFFVDLCSSITSVDESSHPSSPSLRRRCSSIAGGSMMTVNLDESLETIPLAAPVPGVDWGESFPTIHVCAAKSTSSTNPCSNVRARCLGP